MAARSSEVPRYSLAHDIANSVTHGVAAMLSIAGLSVLVVLAALKGDPWRIVSFSIYGGTLVALYLASTLYHSIQAPAAKRVFQKLDHIAIYLLIAGTYTPFTLVMLRGGVGWFLFGASWGLAIIGILLKTFFIGRFELLTLALYVGMGWLGIVAIKPVLDACSWGGLIGIVVGGLFYTAGIVFYASKRVPFNHAIWHLFVVAGSVAHFFVVLFVVLP